MAFPDKLKELRKASKLSQDELGEILGISPRHLGKYEQGKVLPNSETLLKIAVHFKCSLDFLMLDEALSEDTIQDKRLLEKIVEVDKMSEKDREVIFVLLDAFVKRVRVEQAVTS